VEVYPTNSVAKVSTIKAPYLGILKIITIYEF